MYNISFEIAYHNHMNTSIVHLWMNSQIRVSFPTNRSIFPNKIRVYYIFKANQTNYKFCVTSNETWLIAG